MPRLLILVLLLGACISPLTVQGEELKIEREIILNLSPGENNPRNSEGDFVRLKDGRIMFVFSQQRRSELPTDARRRARQSVRDVLIGRGKKVDETRNYGPHEGGAEPDVGFAPAFA